ncbi:unnamed protein product [Effrenium voratum]|nr:unnamed protein product [Effrenium voratum]
MAPTQALDNTAKTSPVMDSTPLPVMTEGGGGLLETPAPSKQQAKRKQQERYKTRLDSMMTPSPVENKKRVLLEMGPSNEDSREQALKRGGGDGRVVGLFVFQPGR